LNMRGDGTHRLLFAFVREAGFRVVARFGRLYYVSVVPETIAVVRRFFARSKALLSFIVKMRPAIVPLQSTNSVRQEGSP
jgi:hypothetical protein